MRIVFHSHPVKLILRLAIVFALLVVCRIVFYFYNCEIIGTIESSEVWNLLKGSLLFDAASILYAYSLFIILSLIPMRQRVNIWYGAILFWIFVATTAVVSGLNMVDAVYFRYTGSRLTASDVFFADNDNTGLLIFRFAVENWLMVLTWAVLNGLGILAYTLTGRPENIIRRGAIYYTTSSMIFITAILLSIAIIRGGGFGRDIRPITLSNATAYTADPAKATMILSNPFCIIRTLRGGNIVDKKYFDRQELEDIFTPYHYPQDRDSSAVVLGDKNIIIFVLESFSAEHSALLNPDLYPDGKGYTPFLDSLMRGGYYFTRAYANGRKSIDALPSIWMSMPSFKTPFILMPQSIGKKDAMPSILARHGYGTFFFSGSPPGSMGFAAFAKSVGITNMVDKSDFDKARTGHNEYDGYWGIWDHAFIDYMGEVLNTTPEPFFSTIFTISSHHPFVVPRMFEDELPDGTTKIHKGVAYTDMSVRLFFENYGDEPWFRESIFFFVADHVSSERFAAKTETYPGRHHIISFLYTPNGTLKGVDSTVFQQADIMPTLLGLTGVKEPYFAFGRDVLGEGDRTPYAVNYFSSFQIITDSVSLRFDENRTTSVYLTRDSLQRNNLSGHNADVQDEAENLLKAVIQQYYSHIKEKDYTISN